MEEVRMSQQLNYDSLFGDKIIGLGEPHLACALLLDVSGSMAMKNRAIDKLNEALVRFKNSVSKDPIAQKRVDVAIITFSDEAKMVCDFTPISNMPTTPLEAYGLTNMAAGIDMAIDAVKERTHLYQQMGTPCHKPWIFMITDGIATCEQEALDACARRIAMEEGKGAYGKLSFWALGIDSYDSKQLFHLTKRVMELRDQNFDGIFDWLSESMACISQSQVGENIALGDLPINARKAKEDRAIDEDWI